MKAPDIIYLQTCGSCPNYKIDIKECENNCRFEDLAEVTWSQERINETDRVYFSEESVLDLLTTAYFHSYLNTDMGWDECKAKAEKDARYMINRLKGGKE